MNDDYEPGHSPEYHPPIWPVVFVGVVLAFAVVGFITFVSWVFT